MGLKKNNDNIDNFKTLINKIILNENIKEDILNKIDYFNKYGKIVIDGYNLYGKDKNNKDFLELKYKNNYFLCNYTDWDFSKFVTISEKELKNKNIKLERKEKVEYKSNDDINYTTKEEIEEIYNANNDLIYESKLKCDIEYVTNSNGIKYLDNHYFTNYCELNKKWYINNGSIINYSLKKSFFNENSKIEERYLICPEVHKTQFENYYNFIELDEKLFKDFMSGKITINEVLDNIDKVEFQKMLIKNISGLDII